MTALWNHLHSFRNYWYWLPFPDSDLTELWCGHNSAEYYPHFIGEEMGALRMRHELRCLRTDKEAELGFARSPLPTPPGCRIVKGALLTALCYAGPGEALLHFCQWRDGSCHLLPSMNQWAWAVLVLLQPDLTDKHQLCSSCCRTELMLLFTLVCSSRLKSGEYRAKHTCQRNPLHFIISSLLLTIHKP